MKYGNYISVSKYILIVCNLISHLAGCVDSQCFATHEHRLRLQERHLLCMSCECVECLCTSKI